VSSPAPMRSTRRWGEYERTSTTTVNAYIGRSSTAISRIVHNGVRDRRSPDAADYAVKRVAWPRSRQPVDVPLALLESGPAAGVAAAPIWLASRESTTFSLSTWAAPVSTSRSSLTASPAAEHRKRGARLRRTDANARHS